MKYFHEDVDPIVSFVESRGLKLFLLDSRGKELSEPTDLAGLKKYFEDSLRLWGVSPSTYLVATYGSQPDPMMVHEAVQQAETEGSPIVLALVAYNDGGVLSVSNRQFEFQIPSPLYDWWKPQDWSKPLMFSAWRQKIAKFFGR